MDNRPISAVVVTPSSRERVFMELRTRHAPVPDVYKRQVIELASLIGPALIFTGLFEHPEAVLQGRVLIGCSRTLHHFGADSFCFFTGDVGANSLHAVSYTHLVI